MKCRNVWCFPLPLPQDWVSNVEVREQIDRAVRGENAVPELVHDYLKESFLTMREM